MAYPCKNENEKNFNSNKCICQTKVSKITLKEEKTVIYFSNKDNNNYLVHSLDGCLISTNQNFARCDYMITNLSYDFFVLIELKGKDVKHGVKQILSTIENFLKNQNYFEDKKKIYGILVHTAKIPNTSLQKVIEETKINFRFLRNSEKIDITIFN
jgi:hypothetical protein